MPTKQHGALHAGGDRVQRGTRNRRRGCHPAIGEPEQADVDASRRRQLREHSAVSTTARRLHQTDRERTPRQRRAADVDVRGRTLVMVAMPAVGVIVDRATQALAPRTHDRAHAERDQHTGDRELERRGEPRRQRITGDDQHDPDDDQRERMAEPPDRTDHRAARRAPRVADERRHRSQVVGPKHAAGRPATQQRPAMKPSRTLSRRLATMMRGSAEHDRPSTTRRTTGSRLCAPDVS
jgi:hypothetical protein